MRSIICAICGGNDFEDRAVLWPLLIAEWGLSLDEAAYIDRQQGRPVYNAVLISGLLRWLRQLLLPGRWTNLDKLPGQRKSVAFAHPGDQRGARDY